MNSNFSTEGLLFILRWFHIFFGIIWIGLLYYFNFVQGPFLKEASGNAKPEVLGKLLPSALLWFRWGSFWTMVTGLIIIGISERHFGGMNNSWGVTIGTGAILGLIMGSNVWFVIWPNQRKIIQANLNGISSGADTTKEAARALLASRTNTFLSIPMLFFMAASRHMPLPIDDTSHYGRYWMVLLLLVAAIEFNALRGKLGPLETVRGVIQSGFVLTAIIFGLMISLL